MLWLHDMNLVLGQGVSWRPGMSGTVMGRAVHGRESWAHGGRYWLGTHVHPGRTMPRYTLRRSAPFLGETRGALM